MNIGENIRRIRDQKDIKQEVIAAAIGKDIASVSNLENGKRDLKVSELEKIAKALRISTVDLLMYPKTYIETSSKDAEPVEVVLQIRLQKDKKEQVLKLVFGENNLEILNR